MQITTRSYSRILSRQSLVFIALLSLFAGANSAAGQSQDRDNPTAVDSNIIKGAGVGKKVEYYYGFTAGPGELVLTIDLKAKSGATSAEVEVFDGDATKLFYYYPNATTQNERAVKRLAVPSKQQVVLRVALDSSAGDFQIKLGGTVEFESADASATAVPPSSDTTTTASPETAQPTEGTPTSDSSATVETPSSEKNPGKGSKVDLGMNILQAVGTHFALPTTGWLHLVMKDGTTQDIDLSKVKSANVKKQ